MKKYKIIYLLGLFLCFNTTIFAQVNLLHAKKGSEEVIINYLNKKRKTIKNPDKATYKEVLVKKSDSLWYSSIYNKNNNKILHTSYYQTKEKKTLVGKTTHYHLNGREASLRYYTKKGAKVGTSTKWFDNGKVNLVGAYEKGKQHGSWKFYHFNGELALEKIYNNGELEKETFFDEKGKELSKGSFINRKEKEHFKGGKEKYHKKLGVFNHKLQEFRKQKNIKYNFYGRIVVNYVIGIEGKIRDVTIDEKIPKEMNDFIVNWFENLKGWSPRVHLNRKVPVNKIQSINFTKRDE